jgi:hypothetical protein
MTETEERGVVADETAAVVGRLEVPRAVLGLRVEDAGTPSRSVGTPSEDAPPKNN